MKISAIGFTPAAAAPSSMPPLTYVMPWVAGPSLQSVVPQLPQKWLVTGLPELAVEVYSLWVPVTLSCAAGTTQLKPKAEPEILWQSRQWHRACVTLSAHVRHRWLSGLVGRALTTATGSPEMVIFRAPQRH